MDLKEILKEAGLDDKAIKQVQKVFDEKLNEKCSFEK